jgi:hypothetical protein
MGLTNAEAASSLLTRFHRFIEKRPSVITE